MAKKKAKKAKKSVKKAKKAVKTVKKKKIVKKTVKKPKPSMKVPKVTVYSTPTCPYCHMAKDFLKELKVPFKDIDVSKDQKAAEQMIDESGQMGVPVIMIGDKIIVGFDREAIKKALGK